jgi:Protein of unknown function (DUF2949)
MTEKFVQFLQQDLGVSVAQIELALRHIQETPDQLPMILWQYGFVSLGQLDKIFDWLEAVMSVANG